MKYKELIVQMILAMENEDYLFKIYHYVLVPYRREKENEREGNVQDKDC